MKKQPDKHHSKRIDYKVLSFILFTVAFFGIFAIRPAVSLIFTLQKEKSEYEQINLTLEKKIQDIMNTQAQFMELINNKSLVEEALPESHQIRKTEEVFAQGPDINTFNIQNIKILPRETTGVNKVTYTISGAADFAKLLALLNYLDNSRRLITPNTLTIEPTERSTESAELSFTTVLSTYYFVPENAN